MSATLVQETQQVPAVTYGFSIANKTHPTYTVPKSLAASVLSIPVLQVRKPEVLTSADYAPAPEVKPQVLDSPLPASQLGSGYTGLLNFSRNSGVSGVLGHQASMDEEPAANTKIEVCCTAHTNQHVRRLMKSVIRGLKACQEPEKAKEGMGGTYFFTNENGRKVAILKPCDEEPLAPNNPKGYVGRSLGEPGWKPTVRVGEAAMREVAAYLLDHEGWAKVPTSVLVRARHPIFCYNSRMSSVRQSSLDLSSMSMDGVMTLGSTASNNSSSSSSTLPMKLGSLQEFVTHMCDTSEMGPSKFSVSDVHRIGILDIRLFNTDRHAGNMLVREVRNHRGSMHNLTKAPGIMGVAESQYELIPIDHGFCLPETLEACYFEWLHWPQAMLPFTEEELAYIRNLNIEEDKELLRKELPNLRPECLRVMEVSTTLLKKGAEAGLTLHEIALVLTRPFDGGLDEEPSPLEKTVADALQELECELDEVIEEAEVESDGAISEGDEDEDGHSLCSTQDRVDLQVLVKQPSSTIMEDSMLFDLDEEGGLPRTPLGRHSTLSPGGISLGSSLDSAEDFSFAMGASPLASSVNTPGLGTNRGVPAAMGGQQQRGSRSHLSRVPAQVSQLSTSVHVTDGGFLWRRLKSGSKQAGVKRGSHKRAAQGSHGHCLAGKKAYPPPVVAFAPDSLKAVFSDMEEQQWSRFLRVYNVMLDAHLVSGCWRQRLSKDASVAQSCPRF